MGIKLYLHISLLRDYQIKALLQAARSFRQARALCIYKLKAQCLLLLLAFFICRWRAVVDDEQRRLRRRRRRRLRSLADFLLFLTFCASSFIMSAQLCTRQRRLSDLKHAHLLSALPLPLRKRSLSLSALLGSAALSLLLRSLAYCMRLAAQSARLFIVCCSYDLRFSCCCLPSLTLSPQLTIDGRTVAAAGRNYATCWNFTRLA